MKNMSIRSMKSRSTSLRRSWMLCFVIASASRRVSKRSWMSRDAWLCSKVMLRLLAPRAASGSTVPAFYPLEPSHMPSRRGAIALTQEEQEKFLAESWTLQVDSVGHKGYPHLVAMWYVVMDGKIHFTTFGKSQKLMNLRRDSKIPCMLESGRG